MRLTDTQLVLLSTASRREDRGIELSSNLKGAAARKVLDKLLTKGLIEELAARDSLPVWRRDEENRALALRITKHGLHAIQVDDTGSQPGAAEGTVTEQGADLAWQHAVPAGSCSSQEQGRCQGTHERNAVFARWGGSRES